jgi:hypothetical protein
MAGERFFLEDIKFFGTRKTNPALAQILMSGRTQAVVADYTLRVLSHFVTRQGAQEYKDWGRQFRAGGHRPGQLLEQTSTTVDVGGADNDRWVGQITIGVVYGAATMSGRKAYAQYPGNKNLQEALHAVLPSAT